LSLGKFGDGGGSIHSKCSSFSSSLAADELKLGVHEVSQKG